MIGTAEIMMDAGTAAGEGRRESFLRIIAAYGSGIRRLANAYVDRTEDREDLVQEIAAAIWRALPGFRARSTERTWLYRIAHNTAITASTKLRRRSRAETTLDDAAQRHNAMASQADDRLIRDEKRELLLAAVRRLAPGDRQIITLHLEGFSHTEIEAVTGLNAGAIATRLSRVRDRLTTDIRGKEVGQ